MTAVSKTALALVIIGAVNWLLVGLLKFNLVSAIFGDMSVPSRIVYILVGFAGIYCLSLLAAKRTHRASESAEAHRRAA